jgi:hypothetical protein
MTHPFDGINEKLKRSSENIRYIESEVTRFFEESDYPVFPQDDKKLILEAIEYHRQREIPPRFSVLIGEVVHHLRSCLDHIAWHFSTLEYRRDHFRRIEFPVLEAPPGDKDTLKRYEGKIKGITISEARRAIEALQPYNAPDPVDSPLLILHNMDIWDKHRELVLCFGTGAIAYPPHDSPAGRR